MTNKQAINWINRPEIRDSIPSDQKTTEAITMLISCAEREQKRSIDGVKPKHHKGHTIRDWWTCGSCGAITHDEVTANYCHHCGYKIRWDSIRCMTGIHDDKDKR